MTDLKQTLELKHHKAGVYSTLDEKHWIVRVEHDRHGPLGGTHYHWEHGTRDEYGLVIESDFLGITTLREARKALAELIEREQ